MHSHSWLNLIMFVTIAALAAFLYIKPSLQEEATHKIASLSPETVQRILIDRNDTSIELSRSDNRWYMRKPVQGRVNEVKIERILEILSATSQHFLPLENLDRYGLMSPVVELQIDQETFIFGDLAPITNEQYVATKQHVFLVSPRYAAILSILPADLLDTKILAEEEIPVEFVLKDFHLKRKELWQVSPQHPVHTPSQAELEQWVKTWQMAHANYLTVDSDISDTHGVEISVVLQDGTKIRLIARQNESEFTLFHVDKGIRYHFSNSMAKQLLDPYSIVTDQSIVVE